METQLSTIASNSALLSSATTACATEINVVFGLYQTNAESLAQVAKCAQLIAQEYARIIQECLDARGWKIYIPFYNFAFLFHGCVEFHMTLIGLGIDVVCILLIGKIG